MSKEPDVTNSDEKTVSMAEGEFTEELIAEMRRKCGLKLKVDDGVFNEEVTAGAIRRFADGVGDSNPLFRDRAYANKTHYGSLIAPPSFVFSVLAGLQFGWRGLAGFHSGSEMEFYRPIRVKDVMRPEETFLNFDGPKKSNFAGRMIIDYFEDKYFNQREELASKVIRWVIRTERAKAREKKLYHKLQLPHPWTAEELERVEAEAVAPQIRGANPRYLEDTQVGEELPNLVKGPLGLTDMVAFFMAGASPVHLSAHEVSLMEYRQRPAWAFRDVKTSALEPIFAVHYNSEAAKAMGVPHAYTVGTQTHCWQIQHMTNWIGDDGFLKYSRAEYRKFHYLSDVAWMKGKVTKKYIDEKGFGIVEIETHAFNQRGEDFMPGSGIAILPTKAGKQPKEFFG